MMNDPFRRLLIETYFPPVQLSFVIVVKIDKLAPCIFLVDASLRKELAWVQTM